MKNNFFSRSIKRVKKNLIFDSDGIDKNMFRKGKLPIDINK